MWKEWKSISNTRLKIQDAAVWLVTVGVTLFYILCWKYLPDQAALHWNGAGVIDNYGDARGYIMLIIMMYFFLAWHVLSKILPGFAGPDNYFGKELSEKAAEEDRKKAARLLLCMLWWCDLIVEAVLAYIIVCGVTARNLGGWFLPAVFAGLGADFIWFFVRMGQLKRKIRRADSILPKQTHWTKDG